jgi:hypothetical protein
MNGLNGMNGPFLAFAVLAGLIGAGCFAIAWHWHQADARGKGRRAAAERAGAAVFGVAGFAVVIGLAPLLTPVWQATGKGAGVVVLIGTVFITGLFAVLMIFRGKAHHWQGSTAMAVLFGGALALVIGGWRSITHTGRMAMSSAGHSMTGFISGNHASTAGTAASANGGSHTTLYVFLGVAGAFLLAAVRGYLKSRPKPQRRKNTSRPEINPAPAVPGPRGRGGQPA